VFKELARRIDNHFPQVEEAVPNLTSSETLSALDKVDLLCSRFHAVVNQLHQPKRGNKSPSRSSLKSEYDVQELLHALLWIFFPMSDEKIPFRKEPAHLREPISFSKKKKLSSR